MLGECSVKIPSTFGGRFGEIFIVRRSLLKDSVRLPGHSEQAVLFWCSIRRF